MSEKQVKKVYLFFFFTILFPELLFIYLLNPQTSKLSALGRKHTRLWVLSSFILHKPQTEDAIHLLSEPEPPHIPALLLTGQGQFTYMLVWLCYRTTFKLEAIFAFNWKKKKSRKSGPECWQLNLPLWWEGKNLEAHWNQYPIKYN